LFIVIDLQFINFFVNRSTEKSIIRPAGKKVPPVVDHPIGAFEKTTARPAGTDLQPKPKLMR